MGIDVRAPDGRTSTVPRRLRWPRWRKFDLRRPDSLDAPWAADDLVGILAGVVVLLLVFVMLAAIVLLFLPLIIFVAEAVVVLVAATVLGRRWLVVASTVGPPADERTWEVRGSLASRRAVREVADELRAGVEAAPTQVVE